MGVSSRSPMTLRPVDSRRSGRRRGSQGTSSFCASRRTRGCSSSARITPSSSRRGSIDSRGTCVPGTLSSRAASTCNTGTSVYTCATGGKGRSSCTVSWLETSWGNRWRGWSSTTSTRTATTTTRSTSACLHRRNMRRGTPKIASAKGPTSSSRRPTRNPAPSTECTLRRRSGPTRRASQSTDRRRRTCSPRVAGRRRCRSTRRSRRCSIRRTASSTPAFRSTHSRAMWTGARPSSGVSGRSRSSAGRSLIASAATPDSCRRSPSRTTASSTSPSWATWMSTTSKSSARRRMTRAPRRVTTSSSGLRTTAPALGSWCRTRGARRRWWSSTWTIPRSSTSSAGR